MCSARRVRVYSLVWPSRSTDTFTVVPSFPISSSRWLCPPGTQDTPSAATIRSPAWMPASWALPPATTLSTSSPCSVKRIMAPMPTVFTSPSTSSRNASYSSRLM